MIAKSDGIKATGVATGMPIWESLVKCVARRDEPDRAQPIHIFLTFEHGHDVGRVRCQQLRESSATVGLTVSWVVPGRGGIRPIRSELLDQ